MERYDYIIAGAGCAGLSLLVHLLHSGRFNHKRILLTDRVPKTANDHTWCFWEAGTGLFEPVVSQRWRQLMVHFPGLSKTLSIAPYQYKMIRADDFYRHCFGLIAQHPNVTVRYGEVEGLRSEAEEAVLNLSGQEIRAGFIFSSIDVKPFVQQPGRHYLLQHFKGWIIEGNAAAFDATTATLMDFRLPQAAGTTFIYTLPLSGRKAMVEATVFSKEVLEEGAYVRLLQDYLQVHYPAMEYRIIEEEYGVIPMTSHHFPVAEGRIVYLGTAGGQTKASTGYTFMPIQRHSAQLTQSLIVHDHPYIRHKKSAARFRLYDRILLHLLANNLLAGDQIFKRLFEQNSPQAIFRFLDNASTLPEELKLTMTLQKGIFIKAALKEIFPAPDF